MDNIFPAEGTITEKYITDARAEYLGRLYASRDSCGKNGIQVVCLRMSIESCADDRRRITATYDIISKEPFV